MSGNFFLLVTECDAAGRGVGEQFAALAAGSVEAALPALEEHEMVRVVRDVETEIDLIRTGTPGTVVSVCGGGETYAVEFIGLPGGMQVIFLDANILVSAGEVGGDEVAESGRRLVTAHPND